MRIFSIKTNNNLSNINSPMDKQIKMLEQQRTRLQERIQKIKEGDSSKKIKEELIKPLNEQIEQIKVQIQQKRLEKIKPQKKANKKKANADNEVNRKDKGNIKIDNTLNLIKSDTDYSQLKNLRGVSENLSGRANILRIEAKLDGSRGNSSSEKLVKANKFETRIGNIEKEILNKSKDIQKTLNTEDEKHQYNKSEEDEKIEFTKDERGKANNKEYSKKGLNVLV